MSPGARSILMDLCNLADQDGRAWPSLDYLAERIERSKASVSTYIGELRKLGLVETIRRKMPSGYDYKLEFLVTFWADWVDIRSRKKIKAAPKAPIPKTERSVQQTERPTSSINNTQNTHYSPAQTRDEKLVRDTCNKWTSLTKGAPFGQLNRPVSEKLKSDTEAILQDHDPEERRLVFADTKQKLFEFWTGLDVKFSDGDLDQQAKYLSESQATDAVVLQQWMRDTSAAWKPFWKKPPTLPQFEKMASEAAKKQPFQTQLRIISMQYVFWKSREKRLNKAA